MRGRGGLAREEGTVGSVSYGWVERWVGGGPGEGVALRLVDVLGGSILEDSMLGDSMFGVRLERDAGAEGNQALETEARTWIIAVLW